ncbi:hypothetical protein J4403_03135 [Candidatus Woesearchaeota archaeon]|nr:hypothetical protein [Candidatus Woesearchaeota archaeon]
MDIKSLLRWIKILGVISLVVIFVLFIFSIYLLSLPFESHDGYIFLIVWPIWIIIVGIIALWGLSFFINHLVKINKKSIANLILILGLFGSLTLMIVLVLNFANFLSPVFGLVSIIIHSLIFLLILYFAIALKIINN